MVISSNPPTASRRAHVRRPSDVHPARVDDTLIKRAVAGESSAREFLFEQLGLILLPTATTWAESLRGVEAEDLVQEGCLKIMRMLGAYSSGAFAGWAVRVMINMCIDLSRRRQLPLQDAPLNEDGDPSHHAIERAADPGSKAAFRHVESRDHVASLADVLRRLDPTNLQTLSLRLDGHPDAEIGKRLGLTPKAVSIRRARALNKLREMLGDT